MIRAVHKALAPLSRRLGVLVSRAVVHLVDDGKRTQRLQVAVLADEVRDSVEHMQPAGFKSVPLAGAEAVVLAVGGNGDHRVAVVVHDKTSRPQGWNAGDVGIYHQKTGDLIWLRADGSIQINASQRVVIKATLVQIEGDLQVNGQVSDAVGSMQGIRTAHNGHAHPPSSTPPSVQM